MAQIFSLKNSKFFSGLKKICAIVPPITTFDSGMVPGFPDCGLYVFCGCGISWYYLSVLEPIHCIRMSTIRPVIQKNEYYWRSICQSHSVTSYKSYDYYDQVERSIIKTSYLACL